ncbi:MAG TPA: TetR/AcrR family transcriptional regulator [Chitinophaga sp.]|uniref:TetR/AcrR family transcriptional regulator n=1 Tax=Chitinophaga sp. TaxID=1869181 RepID=UPI002C24D118|nr:TetR/AcrR family transcriptional regulator [Chitinophaga sp.]HVI48997.1 TetR/AcrR family transcriptional regulator [Chitinophaga sp.]
MFAEQTFLNLPVKRQQAIINTAVEEFALKEYESASLSTIVQKLGLAKGSFYRYFRNKEILYRYLMNYAIEFRLEKEKDLLQEPVKDFFDLLIENFKAKIKFDLEYPVLSGFLYNVAHEKNSDELGNIQEYVTMKMMNPLIRILKEKIRQGQIRDDISPELMAVHVLQVQHALYDYLSLIYRIDFRKNIKKKKPVLSLPEDEILKAATGFALLLKNGLTAPKKKRG